MESWRSDARREPIVVALDALVPKDHLLRKIEKVMDYERLYGLRFVLLLVVHLNLSVEIVLLDEAHDLICRHLGLIQQLVRGIPKIPSRNLMILKRDFSPCYRLRLRDVRPAQQLRRLPQHGIPLRDRSIDRLKRNRISSVRAQGAAYLCLERRFRH